MVSESKLHDVQIETVGGYKYVCKCIKCGLIDKGNRGECFEIAPCDNRRRREYPENG
ncbi:hypothetical protein LCGC14_0946030 [marine sediment metagenome]|uniref:Uncharacterized protein n=1 Tax=marine sediment metagenome TaxID=412755 RepID=A0A0F9P4R3_9ZZZZ